MRKMSTLYSIRLSGAKQTELDDSFIGGRPKLPVSTGIPTCRLCGTEQAFFFQIAFPADHQWTGFSLAVFACTSCSDENYLIPEMLSGPLSNADIPAGFLSRYQRNFRIEVFSTGDGRLRGDYQERIAFRRIGLKDDAGSSIGQLGGVPTWVLEDESPRTYDSTVPMHFILQLNSNLNFETVPDAPPQMEVGLTGALEPSPFDFYRLFIGNAIYFFGAEIPAVDLVYILTQVE